MLELNFKNLDALTAKAESIVKLKRERDTNKQLYAQAFEDLLTHPGVQAVLALKDDNIKFVNTFANPKISLDREYGIKGGQFVQYISKDQEKETGEVVSEADEDFDDTTAPVNSGAREVIVRPKKIKPENMVNDVMKKTDDICSVYDAWVGQILALGNSLAEAAE